MEIYKLGRKAFVALPMKSYTAEKAISKANEHFKVKRELLEIHEGRTSGGGLWIDGFKNLKNNVWVVTRREKA